MGLYLLVCLIFGTTFGAIKIGLDDGFSPFLFGGIRFAIAGFFICLYFAIGSHQFQSIPKRRLAFYFACGLLSIGFNFAGVYYGSQYLPSGIVSSLAALNPMIIALVVVMIDKAQTITKLQYVAILLGLIGVLGLGFSIAGLEWSYPIVKGFLAIILAEIAMASGFVLSRRGKQDNIHPVFVGGITMLSGGMLLLLMSFVFEPISGPKTNLGWFALAYLIVIGSMIGHTAFMTLNYRYGSLIASSWQYVTPAIALGFGSIFLGEPFSLSTLLAMSIILVSVILMTGVYRQAIKFLSRIRAEKRPQSCSQQADIRA